MKMLDHQMSLDAHEWRARISNGLSEPERTEFAHWIAESPAHGEAFAEAEIMWGALGRINLKPCAAPTELSDTPFGAVVEPVPSSDPWAASAQISRPNYGPRIAAGILTLALAAAIWILVYTPVTSDLSPPADRTRFVSGPASSKMINLPDGSLIRLEPNSDLSVGFSETKRVVEVAQGDAFYAVASEPTRPFLVRTGNATIEVTGTRFTTELRDGGVEVAVIEGSVDVYASADVSKEPVDLNRFALTAGDVIWTDDGREVEVLPSLKPENASASRQTQTVTQSRVVRRTYRNEALSKVVADMNRYASSPITVASQATGVELTGTFNIADTDALLATIDLALPVQVMRDEQGVRIIPDSD